MIQAALCAVLSLSSSALAPHASAAETAASTPTGAGVIFGNVTNKATGNGLTGARIEIPAIGAVAFVDSTGRYRLDVPAGSYEVVASFTGLDTQRTTINVTAGQPAVRDFELASGVYVLDAFKVASTKEGLSSALQLQRNADNLKNVASMDALSDLPNMNATELAIRLPGVTFADPGDEVVEQVSVRGMGAGSTSITIDGGGMSSFSAQNRNTRMTAFTGSMFEALELTKGQTPDRPVDSLGGSINFKTKSPLSMRERRRVYYNFQYRTAPYFTEQVPLREARRNHELLTVQVQQKFAVFGSEVDNLAVSVNAFYSENAFGFFRTTRDFQQTNTQPAYLWDYRTTDNYNNRKQRSINTKWDYRLSRNSILKLNLIYNDAPEPMRRQYLTRAFAGSQTTAPSATSGVVPGFTNRITVVRAVPIPLTSTNTSATTQPALIDQTSTLINRDQRLRHGDIAGEHKLNDFEIDWGGLWSRTRYRYLGAEGVLNNRIGNIPFVGPNGGPGSATNNVRGPNGETGVGWILDRTQDDLYPKFTQNGGLDFTNPNNYRPAVNGLTTQSGNLDVDLIKELRANVRYKLPIDSFTAFLKTGYMVRDHNVELYRVNRRWSYTGTDALKPDTSILLWDKVKTSRNIPTWEAAEYIQNGQPTNPLLWQEDKYYYYSNRLSASNRAHEVISSYYLMSQGKIGSRFGYLGGIRREITNTTSYYNPRARILTTAAQQTADPEGSAIKDYKPARNEGEYGQNFPSLHTWYDVTSNLKARAAWSTGFARPTLGNGVQGLTVVDNGTTTSVNAGNPNLKPTRAYNWDFSVEYTLPNSGQLNVGWFYKKLEDYIVSGSTGETVPAGADNGFNGEYAGFEYITNRNVGTAYTAGWELSYIQQLRFLPGPLKGLSLNFNWSEITAHGDYGVTGQYAKDKNVKGFIPRTVNVGLSWYYKKLGLSASYNYNAEQIRDAYNFGQPSRNRYLLPREIVNAGASYQIRPNVSLKIGIANLFNEPQIYYRSIPDQMETFLMQGTTMTASVEGRF
jgi:iron complex outermembrane receptor protein